MDRTFIFASLPQTLAEMQAMPEASLMDPYCTAALTVAALCRYGTDKNACVEMLNFLRGPRPLSPYDVQFLRDRLGGKAYKPFSYFEGAVPANDYTPNVPYVITVSGNPPAPEDNYKQFLLKSGGADSPRPITMRKKGDGRWMLWEQMLLADIRTPKSQDPWA